MREKRERVFRFDNLRGCFECRFGVAFLRRSPTTRSATDRWLLRSFRCLFFDLGVVSSGALGSRRTVIPVDLQNFVTSIVREPPGVGKDRDSTGPGHTAAATATALSCCRSSRRRRRIDNEDVLDAWLFLHFVDIGALHGP